MNPAIFTLEDRSKKKLLGDNRLQIFSVEKGRDDFGQLRTVFEGEYQPAPRSSCTSKTWRDRDRNSTEANRFGRCILLHSQALVNFWLAEDKIP